MQDVDVLLRRALRDGDRGAFDELHAATYSAVLRMAKVHVSSAEEAEDIVQAAFLILHKRGRRIGDQKAYSVWMWRTVRFLAMRLHREKKRRKGAEVNQVEPPSNQDRTALGELFDKLGADDRRILILRYFHGLTVEEVGQTLNLTTAAAQMRIGRALDRAKRKGGPGLLAVLLGLASAGNSDTVVPPSPLTGNVSLRTHQLASSYTGSSVLLQGLGGAAVPIIGGSSALIGTLAIGFWLLHRPPAVDTVRLDQWAKKLEGRYRGISNVSDSVVEKHAMDALVVIRRMKNPDRLELRKQEGDRPVDSLAIYPVLGKDEVWLDGTTYPAQFSEASFAVTMPKRTEDIYLPGQKFRDEVSGETRIEWQDGNFRYYNRRTGTRFWSVGEMKLTRSQD